MHVEKLKRKRINCIKAEKDNRKGKVVNIDKSTSKKISLIGFIISFFLLLSNCNQVSATSLISEVEEESTQLEKTNHCFCVDILKYRNIMLDDLSPIMEGEDEKNLQRRLDSLREEMEGEVGTEIASEVMNDLKVGFKEIFKTTSEYICNKVCKSIYKSVLDRIILEIEKKIAIKAGKKVAKGIGKKVLTSLIPFIGPIIAIADTAYDVYDITRFVASSTKAISYLRGFEKTLEELFKNFEIDKNTDIQNSTKKSINLCIEFISKVNNLYEEQNNYVEKIFRESKDSSKTHLVKTRSFNKELCNIDSFKSGDLNTKSNENIYNSIDRYTDEYDNFSDIAEYTKNFEKHWPFLYKLEIKYGNQYIEDSKYTIDNIDKLINLIEEKWLENVIRVTSRIEYSIDRIIYYRNKRKADDIYLNESIKYTINTELEKLKNNVNNKVYNLKNYKKEIVTIKEDIIKIIKEDINHKVNKLKEKRERDELITKQNKFLGDILSIIHDVIDYSYSENIFPELEAYTNTISRNSFEEMGKILFEIHNMIKTNRRFNKSKFEEKSEETNEKENASTHNTNDTNRYKESSGNSSNQAPAPGLPPSGPGGNNNPETSTYSPSEKKKFELLVKELFKVLNKFLKERFGLNEPIKYFQMQSRFMSILEQNDELRCENILIRVSHIVSALIDETLIPISDTMEFIIVFEYVFSYLRENITHDSDMTFDNILLDYDSDIRVVSKELQSSRQSQRPFSFFDLRTRFINLVEEYITFLDMNMNMFSNIASAVYHYNKHKKMRGRTLTFIDYLLHANLYINIIVEDYDINGRGSIVNHEEYRINYSVTHSQEYRSDRYRATINSNDENIKLRLIFNRDHKGKITIITFYEMN